MDFNNTELSEPVCNKTISAKAWFLYILLCLIPVINVIFLLTNALSEKNDLNIKNFAKAALIWVLLSMTLEILVLLYFINAIY